MENSPQIGVQTFGLGNELQTDFEGAIVKLKSMGFSSIEPLILPMKKQGRFPANLWSQELLARAYEVVKANGLSMPSAHVGVGFGPIRLPEKQMSQMLREIADRFEIQYFVFSGMFANDSGAKSWGRYLGRLSNALEDTGAVIVYHNHDVEFTPLVADGRLHYPLDTFFEYAGSKVKLQLDIGWAAFAGDESELFRRYSDRIVILHGKDFYDGVCRTGVQRDSLPASAFAPIGAGAVRTEELVSAYLALPSASGNIIIDQDKCAGDRFEELRIGLENLKSYIREADDSKQNDEESIPVIVPPAASLDRGRLSLMTFSLALERMTHKLTIEDTLRLAAEAGIPSVDLMNVGAKDIPATVSAMNATGVSVNCYIANIPFFASEKTIREKLDQQMSIAAALRSKFFMIVPYVLPTELKKAKRLGKQKVRKLMISGFQTAVAEGKKRGLTVCFETTPHDELALSSAEDCGTVLNAVDGLKLVFDTANMLPAGEAPLDYYEKLKEHIVHVHLKDVLLTRGKTLFFDECAADGRKMNCCVWGEGEIPVATLYDRMIRDGYTGDFAIEYARPSGIADFETHLKQLEEHFRLFEE